MLNKHLIIFILVFFPTLIFAQSKWSTDIGLGVTAIKGETSTAGILGINYQASNRIKISLNTQYAKPKFDVTDQRFDFHQVSLEAEYAFVEESKLPIVPIFGFSFLHFGDDIDLKHNNGLGVNTGFSLTSFSNDHFRYGFKVVNTYSKISHGGILSTFVFVRYNF